MESAGKYWIPVFNILESKNINVTIANPKWVKAVKGNKDDKKDSKWIGDLFKIDMPDELKAKQEEKAVKQAVKFLEKRGYLVSQL